VKKKTRFVAEYAASGTTPGAHTHPESDVNSLVADLAGKQPLDSDLTAIAALTTTSFGRAFLSLANGAAAQSYIGAADDTLVVKLAGSQTITGTKTFDVPFKQNQSATPATPSAGQNSGPYFKSDGLPYFLNAAGIEVPFNVGDVTEALHSNADFEDQTAGTPDVWSFFWATGTTSVSSVTTNVFSGSRAVSISWGSGSNSQIMQSDVFTVAPNDVINFSIYTYATVGTPRVSLTLQTKASGTPTYFDAGTIIQTSSDVPLKGVYSKYSQTFVVPSGHNVGRVTYRFSPAGTEACTLYADRSASSRTVASAPDLNWVKRRVDAAATGNVTLTAPGATIDGVTMASLDRFLAPSQTTKADCGIYIWNGSASTATRADDAATAVDLAGAQVAVDAGTVNGGTQWRTRFKSTDTLGTTGMIWARQPNSADAQKDQPSSNTTPSGTTNSTITGLSIAVTCPNVDAVYEVQIDSDVTFSGAQTNIIELLVDGSAEAVQIINAATASGQRGQGSKTWPITGLSAGAHTFTARTRNTAGGTAAIVTAAHTVMTVKLLP
jgi:hypothetical protein